jgi:hypothetical protein
MILTAWTNRLNVRMDLTIDMRCDMSFIPSVAYAHGSTQTVALSGSSSFLISAWILSSAKQAVSTSFM